MITIRRANERYHDRSRKPEVLHTFYPGERAELLPDGFGILEVLNECRLPPGTGVPSLPHHGAEIITYVREGALTHQDSIGRSGVIQAGEFQHRTAGRGVHHSEMNPSRADWAQVFQIWLRPSEADLSPGNEQKRFSAADRRGGLCVVASPDGRRGSLRIHQDALMHSAILDPGQHVVHELSHGRSAWLHIVRGEVAFSDFVLTTGDGAGVTTERAVSFTAREETEILLLDLGSQQLK